MKNIILQHWEPREPSKPMPMIVEKSIENISAYAERMGAEYRLLDGEPFQKGLREQCQKCAGINEEFDEYDVVVVLDTDKFMVKGCNKNIFEAKGNLDYPIWSGACYVMPRDFRQLMRKQINPAMRRVFEMISPRSYVDEGMFHVMCHKAGFKLDKYLDERWDYSSYKASPEKAWMLHIRHKPKTRDENYLDLVDAGII